MARRREETAVSFFSFQDIMTSLSGIMLFIVLLLVLDLTSAAVRQPKFAEARPSKTEVLSEIKELSKEITRIQSRIELLRTRTRELAASDPGAIKRQIQRLSESLRRLASEISYRDDFQKQKANEFKRIGREARRLDVEILELAKAKARLEAIGRRGVVFALQETDPERSVVVVECSASQMLVRPLESEAAPLVVRERNSSSRQASLTATFKAFPAQDNDFLVVIKPSAFSYGEDLVHFIKGLGYRVGSEPLEEDRSTVGY